MASLSCVDSKEADSDDGRTHQLTTRSENRIPLLLLNWMDNCRRRGREISHHIPYLTGLILFPQGQESIMNGHRSGVAVSSTEIR